MADITITRTITERLASVSIAVAGSNNSASHDPGSTLSYMYEVRVTNGGIGPTQGIIAQLQYTPDSGTTWISVLGFSRRQTVVTVSANDTLWLAVPADFDYPTRVNLTGNTAQAVTVVVRVHERTKAVVA